MSAFTPSTIVYLVDSPVNDYKNQLNFASAAAQATYFLSKLKHSYTNFTYQRKETFIRVPANIETLYDSNYVMYQNSNYGSKWFYCFIKRFEYVNPNTTNVYIETDVFQTWQFDITFLSSFVAREHVADDTAFLHTLAEPTPKIEMVAKTAKTWSWQSQTPSQFDNDYYVGAYASGNGITPVTSVKFTGNVPTSGHLYITTSQYTENLFDSLVQNNYTIDFTTVIPKSAVDTIATNVQNIYVAMDKTESSSWGGDEQYTLSRNLRTITYGNETYTIRNNKINCYPYRYVEMNDFNAQSIILKPEDMNALTFYIHAESGSTPSLTLYFPSYEGQIGFENSISINCFPAVPYAVDYYAQYLALHKNSYEFERMSNNYRSAFAMIDFGEQMSKGNVFEGTASLADDYMRRLGRNAMYTDMKNRPPITRNAPTGNSRFGMNAIGFHINEWYPKKEYIKILDEFFDVYGYNVSTVKVPQFTSRTNWNYIETKEIEIQGDVPKEDLDIIKSMFNSGCTIWHNPTTFGDYSQSNSIV